MDLERLRAQFPVVERMLYLNHAGTSPISRPVRTLIDSHFDTAQGSPGETFVDPYPVKELLSSLFGGSAAEYAIMPNTGTGVGILAAAFPWAPGDNVVLPAEEYPANQYPWLALRHRGVDVRVVPLEPDLRINLERIASQVDARTRVVAVSAVAYLSGFRVDLKRMSRIAHDAGALFVVDGIQAAGVVPLNVDQDGIDVLAAGGYKWLLGPVGTGFAYYRKALWKRLRPLLPGSRSSLKGPEDYLGEFVLQESAQRYETGCMPFPLLHGWTAGLEMLIETGIPAIHQQVLFLTDRLIMGLKASGFTLVSPVDTEAERSGIVVFTTGSSQSDEALVDRLRQQGIVIAFRGGRCRVSPHFYNTAADIDRLLEALV